MKTMLVFVLVILPLLVIPAVSAVPDIPNFESPGQVMAFGAYLLSGETVTICGEVVVPVFNGPGNSDGQLLNLRSRLSYGRTFTHGTSLAA